MKFNTHLIYHTIEIMHVLDELWDEYHGYFGETW